MPREIIKKITIFCLCVIMFVILNGKITHSTLSQTAIIVCVGVDYNEQYVMTAQMVLSGSSSDGAGNNKFVTVFGKGQTLGDCINGVRRECGLNPGFRHSSMIMFGSSLIENGKQDYCVKYFFENDLVPDDVSVIVTAAPFCSDVINGNAPITTISAFQLSAAQNAFAPSAGTVSTDLRKYMALISADNTAVTLPVADVTPINEVSEQQSTDKDKNAYYYKRAVALSNGKSVYLTEEQTLAYTLLSGKLSDGIIECEQDEKTISYRIDYSKGDISAGENKNVFLCKLNLQVVLLGIRQGENNTLDFDAYSEADKKQLEEMLTNYIRQCFSVCREQNVDVFNVYQLLYAKYADEIKKDYLQTVSPLVEIKIKVK